MSRQPAGIGRDWRRVDVYQSSARITLFIILMIFAGTTVLMMVLFLFIYYKYTKKEEGELYFDFYSRMSHDMRTPMNGILGMTALSHDEEDVEVLHHNIAMIEESGTYMLGLINDTLDLQRLDAGKLRLNPKPAYCKELLTSMEEMLKPSMAQKNLDFQVMNKNVDLNGYAMLDIVRIKQVFMNIISNAMKFTPEEGQIRFVMECLAKEGKIEHDKFQIMDTGVGMNAHLSKPINPIDLYATLIQHIDASVAGNNNK